MLNITTDFIITSLFSHFNANKGYKYQLCNSYVFKWESDFFCVAKSGMCYEIEVKVSRNDYLADFRKEEKHEVLAKKGEYIIIKGHVSNVDSWDVTNELGYHYARRSYLQIKKLDEIRPNKFSYAVPAGMVSKDEVPDYAGLIYVSERGMEIIKRPPALHRNKIDLTKTLLEKYYWAYLNMLDQKRSGKNFEFPNEQQSNQTSQC